MKVNPKILSIPPYISTAWRNVLSLHLERKEERTLLLIGLVNGSTIEIPNLPSPLLEAVFKAHEKHLEQEGQGSIPQHEGRISFSVIPGTLEEAASLINLPIKLGLDPNIGNLLQHNPDAADSPDLPEEVLDKIAHLTKAVGIEKGENLPKAEPHCNCIHCQIMRVMQQDTPEPSPEEEELVTEEDLRFRDWLVEQTDEKLFVVLNPLNTKEHYTVFLGKPIGCTCGQSNCEHIKAVLNS